MGNSIEKGFRLKYHIMPPKGWLNDPNGLCFYRGRYHAFFQYQPENVYGGTTCWGHYISDDLLRWEFAGEPIRPDCSWDRNGSYSGCAFVEDGRMEIFYTGNVKEAGSHDYIHTGRQSNTIYLESEDGITFGEKKLLMTSSDYPGDYTLHVRDPKVWKENDQYYMVLGGRKKGDKGAVLLYSSKDKTSWKYEREYTTESTFGYMWECPDLFVLGGQRILSVSPQGLAAEELRYQNKYQSGYFSDAEELKDFTEWDYGFDFYAPQTFRDGRRRILVGWAGVPEMEEEYDNKPTIEEGWQHSFTLFRELSWKNGRVYQYPVEEYKKLRKEELICTGKVNEVPQTYDAEIKFAKDGKEKTICFGSSLQLSWAAGIAELRFLDDSGSGRRLRKGKLTELFEVRIMMDTSMLELYINGGEMVFTTRWFGNTGAGNMLKVSGDLREIHIWEIE